MFKQNINNKKNNSGSPLFREEKTNQKYKGYILPLHATPSLTQLKRKGQKDSNFVCMHAIPTNVKKVTTKQLVTDEIKKRQLQDKH